MQRIEFKKIIKLIKEEKKRKKLMTDIAKININDEYNNVYEICKTDTKSTDNEHQDTYKVISYPIANIILENINKRVKKDFFDRSEEALLSMFIFYFKEVKNQTLVSSILLNINTTLKHIDNIKDFHNLFINIKDESLKSVYINSYFYGAYNEYCRKSIEMTKKEAQRENGWLLDIFNVTFKNLKYKFQTNDINNIIQEEGTKILAMNKASQILSGKLELDKLNKSDTKYLLSLFDKAIDEFTNKHEHEDILNLICFAQSKLKATTLKSHKKYKKKRGEL